VAHGGVLAVDVREDRRGRGGGKAVPVGGGGAHLVLVSSLLDLLIAHVLPVVAVIVVGMGVVVVVLLLVLPMLILLVVMSAIGFVVLLLLALLLLRLLLLLLPPPLLLLLLRQCLQALPFLLFVELKVGVTAIVVLVPLQANVPGRSGRGRHGVAVLVCVWIEREGEGKRCVIMTLRHSGVRREDVPASNERGW
jgi:hypothetical protein